MDLQSQVKDLLDLSNHVTSLLQKQSDTLIRKKTTIKNNNEDLDDLSYDIAMASKSLQILEIRREIRTAVGELRDMDIKEKIESCDENLSSNWYDTMECLHILLKKGIEVASSENPTLEQKSISHKEQPSPKNVVYNNYETQQTLQPTNFKKDRSISNAGPKVQETETIQDSSAKSNTIRRHTMESENVSVARLFVGNLKQSPITTCISSNQTTDPARVPFWSTETEIGNNDSSVLKHLSQLIIHENEELDDEFVDAVENQESNSNFGDTRSRKELSSLSNSMKRSSSVYSLPTTLNTTIEDDSCSHMSDYDDNFSETSFAHSSSQPFQISFNRCSKPSNLFAENVTLSNPLRIGKGIGSYIVYTCTVDCPEGLSFTVRKRYSDFVKLRSQLIKAQPKYRKLVPSLPPKKIVGKFVPEFIEKRRKDMEYFLTYVLLHPVLGTTPVVRWWLID